MRSQTLFRTIVIGIGNTAMELYSGGERWGSTVNTAWASGIYSQRTGWGSTDGKVLGGNIMSKGDAGLTDLTQFLLNTGQGDQTSPGVQRRMRNLVRYQE